MPSPPQNVMNLCVRSLSLSLSLVLGLLLAPSLPRAAQADVLPDSRTHVGQDLPDYVTGDECLFCHRAKIGPGWQVNGHQLTLRAAISAPQVALALKNNDDLEPFARQIQYVLGYRSQTRLLRKSSAYGQLDLLTAPLTRDADDAWQLKPDTEPPHRWDTTTFAQECAGCHATAVDSRTQAFSAIGIDCYACHGVVELQHTKAPEEVFLSPKRMDSPQLIAATCGQCHIRTGRSKASGLPYANNHVVGDDLFTDFTVDFSDAAIASLPPRDRHVLINIRDIQTNKSTVTCLDCHNIHRADGRTHRRVSPSNQCQICHPDGDRKRLTYDRKSRHNTLCGY